MFLEDLRAAGSPAIALLLEGFKAVRQKPPPVTTISVKRPPAALQDREAKVSIFANRVARPASGALKSRAPNQTHRAMNDDGIVFVALDHSDVKEPGILAVHDMVHEAAVGIAMVLRGLDQADRRISKARNEILEPIGMDRIVSVDHADDLRIRSEE